MADEPEANPTAKWLLIIAVIAVILLLLWQFGMFGTGQEDVEPTYEAGVTDVGGGELIVRDPAPGEVQVDEPDTPMTPVPAESPSPAPTAE
jgi:hypothetical protein